MTLVFDFNIETLPPPKIYRTADGHYNEVNAARYLSYKMVRGVDWRTLRRWRRIGIGPNYYSPPTGLGAWYTQADLDDYVYLKCAAHA